MAHRIDEHWIEGRIDEVLRELQALPEAQRREVVEEVRSYRSGRTDREKFDEVLKRAGVS